MHGIDTHFSVAERPACKPAENPAGVWFRDCDPENDVPGTTVSADFLNDLYANLLAVLVAGGVVPEKCRDEDLLNALSAIIDAAIAMALAALMPEPFDNGILFGDSDGKVRSVPGSKWDALVKDVRFNDATITVVDFEDAGFIASSRDGRGSTHVRLDTTEGAVAKNFLLLANGCTYDSGGGLTGQTVVGRWEYGGALYANGGLFSSGADLLEWFPATGPISYGAAIVIDPDSGLARAAAEQDSASDIIGIVSDPARAALIGGQPIDGAAPAGCLPVGLLGQLDLAPGQPMGDRWRRLAPAPTTPPGWLRVLVR